MIICSLHRNDDIFNDSNSNSDSKVWLLFFIEKFNTYNSRLELKWHASLLLLSLNLTNSRHLFLPSGKNCTFLQSLCH